jgi:DNA-binding beta-propeller fold protein YncE
MAAERYRLALHHYPDMGEAREGLSSSRCNAVNGRGHTLLTPTRLLVANMVLALLLVAGVYVYVLRMAGGGYVVLGGDPVLRLQPLLTVTGPGSGQYPEFLRPLDAAFGPDGEMWVVDTGNNRLVVLGRSGGLIREFGGFGVTQPLAGSEPEWSGGLMNQPAGIDVDENGTVYVADPRNNHVQVFDRGGTFLRRFPEATGVPREDVSAGTTVTPMDVAVAGDSVYVADVDRLLVFTNKGEFLRPVWSGRHG